MRERDRAMANGACAPGSRNLEKRYGCSSPNSKERRQVLNRLYVVETKLGTFDGTKQQYRKMLKGFDVEYMRIQLKNFATQLRNHQAS